MDKELRDAFLNEFNTEDDYDQDLSYDEQSHMEIVELGKSVFPTDIKEWDAKVFQKYTNSVLESFGKENEDFAWEFIYAKILERAGEGKGGVEFTEEQFENSKRKQEEDFKSGDEYDDDEEDM